MGAELWRELIFDQIAWSVVVEKLQKRSLHHDGIAASIMAALNTPLPTSSSKLETMLSFRMSHWKVLYQDLYLRTKDWLRQGDQGSDSVILKQTSKRLAWPGRTLTAAVLSASSGVGLSTFLDNSVQTFPRWVSFVPRTLQELNRDELQDSSELTRNKLQNEIPSDLPPPMLLSVPMRIRLEEFYGECKT